MNPNTHETLPPGDIPDTVAYVPTSLRGGLRIATPEGFSRSDSATATTFTDKLNTITLGLGRGGAPPTPSTVRAHELPAVIRATKGFRLGSISTVTRHAGPAVRVTYLGDSAPNAVTGKVGTLAFERYDFFGHGREVVLLLSSPQGSDNVDPWRKVSDSLRFPK